MKTKLSKQGILLLFSSRRTLMKSQPLICELIRFFHFTLNIKDTFQLQFDFIDLKFMQKFMINPFNNLAAAAAAAGFKHFKFFETFLSSQVLFQNKSLSVVFGNFIASHKHCAFNQMRTFSLSLSLSLSRSHTDTHTHTQAHSLSLTLRHTPSLIKVTWSRRFWTSCREQSSLF